MGKKYMLNNYLKDARASKFLLAWFLLSIAALIWSVFQQISIQKCPYVWHGGNPEFKGSCWCSADQYCMCTPSLAIDAIITVKNAPEPSIVLVRRRDNPRDIYALPGGFVDIGETIEHATIREVKEETNLDLLHLSQFRVYSDPKRDKRRHTGKHTLSSTIPIIYILCNYYVLLLVYMNLYLYIFSNKTTQTVSAVFHCVVDNVDTLKRGDDAKAVETVPIKHVLSLALAFDHHAILTDFLKATSASAVSDSEGV